MNWLGIRVAAGLLVLGFGILMHGLSGRKKVVEDAKRLDMRQNPSMRWEPFQQPSQESLVRVSKLANDKVVTGIGLCFLAVVVPLFLEIVL